MKNPKTLLLFIFAFGIFACEDAKPKILQEEKADTDIDAQSITIQLQENGGMLPYSTEVLISNKEESYVAFFVDGIKNKVSINPSREEVQAIVKTMQKRNFAKIKTSEVEALDRGGSSVNLSLNGESISISNMGFSFVRISIFLITPR